MLWITDFGALGDGKTDNSPAFSQALSKIESLGGGELGIPAGVFLTGPIELPSGLRLNIGDGAVLQFIPEFSRYAPVWTRWEGVECYAMHPLIFAKDKSDITIRGSGTIDGSGKLWWQHLRAIRESGRRTPNHPIELELARLNPDYKDQPSGGGGRETQFLRPPLLQFYQCSNVRVEGVTLQNSPFWNTHPVYCRGLTFQDVTFINPHDAPNTDGLDLDSCQSVVVKGCVFRVGDDCLALKSGAGEDGLEVNIPCKDIQVVDCQMFSGHGGIVIGSETAGGIENLMVNNCTMKDTDRGIRIKTRRGRGGRIANLEFQDIQIDGSLCPLVINSYYRCGADTQDTTLFSVLPLKKNHATPEIADVRIKNLSATGCRSSLGFIAGLPEQPVSGLSLENCKITMAGEEDRVSPAEAAMTAGMETPSGHDFILRFVDQPKIKDCSFPLLTS